MVARGRRPAHRNGTVGRPFRRFRARLVDNATHCQNPTCGKALVRDAPCTHPTHQRLKGCPTYHAYPTLEHPHRLIDGGAVRDQDNALVFCFECNARGGRGRRPTTPTASRRW